ncbi:MAG: 30S ribosomal protein S4 [Candidatus Moranbacteria bacterium]|jgi:small subunit ribosomal protein S4|nr:30S ribosomal protein S4 [Candidatus Moranbacteria bacterium]MDD5651822.1 30S ribosomal protein S4 [Candidatus Moranbacteria bacterium]MDX9855491.1 30S ribosomal protein S4 [Candidatus Moranbacteria bacterium]
MATDLNPKCKKCRRAGEKLFLKGERCNTPKCGVIRKAYAPGMHGSKMGRALSEYGKQLEMKQRIKRIYGVMERQFRKHFEEASRKQGVTGNLLMMRLEMRLDNVVFRLGLADSRKAARQIVGHGSIVLNGKKASIPSMKVKIGDVLGINVSKKDKRYFQERAKMMKRSKDIPSWIALDPSKIEGRILSEPDVESIGVNVDPQLVVEYYSR